MISEPLASDNVNIRPLAVSIKLALVVGFGLFLSPALAVAAVPSAGEFTNKPFWEGKPKLEAKLRDDRAVLVSARTETGSKDPKTGGKNDLFLINGVGWVDRDAKTVFQLAKQFDRLKEISDNFREVKFEAKTNRLFVVCEALGYQARMLLSVTPRPATAAGAPSEIGFKVIDGHFLGLAGKISFRELREHAGRTEVSLRVRHEASKIPIPKILVGFTLEVLIQKVAQKMRTHFENAPAVDVEKSTPKAP